MAVVNLTEKRIREMELGSGIHRDQQVKGLMVICHRTTKTYAVQGDVRRNGRHVRTVRVKIDRVDRIGPAEARRRAKTLMSTIQSGTDPTAGPDETGITLAQALEEHLKERAGDGWRRTPCWEAPGFGPRPPPAAGTSRSPSGRADRPGTPLPHH